jgi:hypothetical protein
MNTGLIFGIIFAIIVIALLFVFGLGQIENIFCVSNVAQMNKVVKELEDATEDVFNLAEGSALPFKLSIPRNAQICFVNASNPARENNWNPDPNEYSIILNRIDAHGFNIWRIYGCGSHDPGYRIRHLRPADNFCAGLGTEVFLENVGHYVVVRKPDSIA